MKRENSRPFQPEFSVSNDDESRVRGWLMTLTWATTRVGPRTYFIFASWSDQERGVSLIANRASIYDRSRWGSR